jgi:hypothetical protein
MLFPVLPLWQACILVTETAMVVLHSCMMFERSMYQKSIPFPCSQVTVNLSILSEASLRFSEQRFFPGWGCQPHALLPTWRTGGPFYVWAITFDLSCLGDPVSCYATAGLALRIMWPHKPHTYIKVETTSVGGHVMLSEQGGHPMFSEWGGCPMVSEQWGCPMLLGTGGGGRPTLSERQFQPPLADSRHILPVTNSELRNNKSKQK